MNNVLKLPWRQGLLSICLALACTLLTSQGIYAQQPPRPEFPQPPGRPDMPEGPPPRPAIPVHSEQPSGNGGVTGQIQVQTQPGAWTVVQWQDGSGKWHDVEGWRTQSGPGTVTWAVEEKDLGSGPFRWIGYASNGRMVATSSSFNLPKAGQTLNVSMSGQWQGGYVEPQHPKYSQRQQPPQQPRQWQPPRPWQPRRPYYGQPQQRQWHPHWRCGQCRHPQWHHR